MRDTLPMLRVLLSVRHASLAITGLKMFYIVFGKRTYLTYLSHVFIFAVVRVLRLARNAMSAIMRFCLGNRFVRYMMG